MPSIIDGKDSHYDSIENDLLLFGKDSEKLL